MYKNYFKSSSSAPHKKTTRPKNIVGCLYSIASSDREINNSIFVEYKVPHSVKYLFISTELGLKSWENEPGSS